MSEDVRSALLRDVQELRDTLEQLQPEDLTETDKDVLRALLRELQALLQLAHEVENHWRPAAPDTAAREPGEPGPLRRCQ